ncbi:synemin [Electrophorus electricus]|uniref:IF rod domain-containing protein n=1 Tax=Electrophorus electricus TaxID=8005 RepID=A0A4W4H2W1_ELEEL|nr:synemin [Electrophorus electricus]
MFSFRTPFESEKLQLQELNQRLSQYLSRAKLLEQENACLIKEIHTIRQNRSGEWESKQMAELREMRRLVEQLSFEKNKAEMERESLRKEFQLIQVMHSDESAVNKGIDGELKGCERQLHHSNQTNKALEECLLQLENEYAFLENAHRKEIGYLRNQTHDRALPVVTQTYGPAAVGTDEVQEYALALTDSWGDTLEMYQQRAEEIEESIKADRARLEDIRREKMQYASELNKLREELEKQSRVQMDLEEQFVNMQENFRGEVNQYQMIIEELEHERSLLANTISEKLKDHQDLLQVKMGLGMELAAYRALLEEEGKLAQMRANRHSRERIIDIKLPTEHYTPRTSTMTAIQPQMGRHFMGYDVRYMEPIFKLRKSTDSYEAVRTVPITVMSQAKQSPAARRDMISFTEATQATATKSVPIHVVSASGRTKEVVEDTSVKIIGESQDPPRTHPPQSETGNEPVSMVSPTAELKSVRVVSPPMMSLSTTDEIQNVVDTGNAETGPAKATVKPVETQFVQQQESQDDDQRDFQAPGKVEPKVYEGKEQILDSVSMEEIIEKVIKPVGLDTKLGSSADSKITCHVEKTEQEDGSTKTQIVLQTKVEEDVDLSDDSALKELLSKGVKKVSLEDIEGTPTGSMIHNLLSLGLQGESLENKSVNVEIIEEPVESDEEGQVEIEETMEIKSNPYFKASAMFLIEESENEPQTTKQHESTDETLKASGHGISGSVHVQEMSRDESLPYYSHGQETQEYIVSTPEDNMSESEEGGGIMSYGHYGVVEDLSDERYYQEETLPTSTRYSDEGDRETLVYVERDSFPECIIEEEVHVSPTVQESILEVLTEGSLDPREQLEGTLEQLEATVPGTLNEELSLLRQADEGSDISIDIKKVEKASDNGTTTIVAQVNVTQCLEESELLDDQADDLNQEQVMAALQSSHPELDQAFAAGADGGDKMRISKTEVQMEDMPWMTNPEETEDSCLASEFGETEKIIRLEPNERSFSLQMDNNSSSVSTSTGGEDFGGQREDEDSVQECLPAQETHPSLTDTHEKRVATIYLESSKED